MYLCPHEEASEPELLPIKWSTGEKGTGLLIAVIRQHAVWPLRIDPNPNI